LRLDETLMIKRQGRYFLLNPELSKLVSEDFFYAGAYLGKERRGAFFPSFNLLAMMAERKEANKIIVDDKTEWLFIVGRDVFKRGILQVIGSRKKNAHTLVMNKHGECLGFGRMLHNIEEGKDKPKVAVKNVSDVGDFLRRERRLKH